MGCGASASRPPEAVPLDSLLRSVSGFVVTVVGLQGAGKSTVVELMRQHDNRAPLLTPPATHAPYATRVTLGDRSVTLVEVPGSSPCDWRTALEHTNVLLLVVDADDTLRLPAARHVMDAAVASLSTSHATVVVVAMRCEARDACDAATLSQLLRLDEPLWPGATMTLLCPATVADISPTVTRAVAAVAGEGSVTS